MTKKILVLALAIWTLCAITSCKSTNSVELFRVNDNGEIVNIGRGADEGHVVYGHFREAKSFDRAAAVVMTPESSGSDSVCYINVNGGQVNEGTGDGIRIDPCVDISILNEGSLLGKLEELGVFYHEKSGDLGIYHLYEYRNGQFELLVKRPVSDELWNSGSDIARRTDDGMMAIQFNRRNDDGSLVTETQSLSGELVASGAALEMPERSEPIVQPQESEPSESENSAQGQDNSEMPAEQSADAVSETAPVPESAVESSETP